jgi:hypothetical protein
MMQSRRSVIKVGLKALLAVGGASSGIPVAGRVVSAGSNSPNGQVLATREWTDAAEFGAKGDGKTDDTTAIQAAIDAAYASNKGAVRLPAGNYKISSPLFLDAPNNLRNSLKTPTIFNFSMAFVGEFELSNHEGFGSRILATTDDFAALWVGPGQGMVVSGITISGPPNAHRNTMSPNGCGIAVAGGNGGASRTIITNCMVENFHSGIATGFNGNGSLADSTSLFRCFMSNCYNGFTIGQAQNYINNLTDCNTTDCTVSIRNSHGPTVNIRGGNFSVSSAAFKSFAVGDFSAFSKFNDTYNGNDFTNYRFTAVVTSPDTAIQNQTYDSAALNLPGFGVVPLRLERFISQSSTATFSFWPQWVFANFTLNLDLSTETDLHAEISHADTLFACENITVFHGRNFFARGCHIENPLSLTRLLDAAGGHSKIEDFHFNYEISHGDMSTSRDDALALFVCQQAFPFVSQASGRMTLNDNNFNQNSVEGVVFDIGGLGAYQLNRNDGLSPPNVRYCYNAPNIAGYSGNDPYSAIRGAIEFDVNPFIPSAFKGNYAIAWRNLQERISGRRPLPISAKLTPAQVRAYSTLGRPGTYPPLCGDTIYAIMDHATAGADLFVKSGAAFYSYGQDLTSSNAGAQKWSYKGQTTKVAMDPDLLALMFPGLKIILNKESRRALIVSELHPALGYVNALLIDDNSLALPGAKTATFIGTIVRQDAYAIRKYP